MIKQFERPLLLRGKVVSPDGDARDRYILVRDGLIESVTRVKPPLSEDAVFVKTDNEDWIFPGLLDLHTHSDYNLLPIWDSINAPYNTRYDWRDDPLYKSEVREPFGEISDPANKLLRAVFGELQAVAGGTAVLQEGTDLERDSTKGSRTLLCRDTADPADLYLDGSKEIFSVVDFFKRDRDTHKLVPVDWSLKKYREGQEKGTLLATLAHVAEGRSGVGSDRGVDPFSRQEFETFMSHPAFKDAQAVKASPFTIIHGCGIDARNPKHIEFLRERNISIVWSPVSNLLLYGDTLDVETLIENGINVALGSDWSPSGSKHVWDEAKFARFYLDAIGSSISDEQIFKMVTTHAASCLGLSNMGRIASGAVADFFILRSPMESDNPLEVFFSTTDEHVRAVMIGGRPIYGERKFLEEFKIPLQSLPPREGSAVKNKAVSLPKGIDVNIADDISKIEDILKQLDPPVKRSNLLASSDKPYQRRIQFLKSSVARFSWSVRQWRKRGSAEGAGLVQVPPDSVRVWRGFRKAGLTPDEFGKQLGSVFIPSAVQTQVPLGMTAYLPTVLPYEKSSTVPDEIALVFFESKEVYGKTFKTTTGRAYGLLHGTVFAPAQGIPSGEPKSASDWPKLLAGSAEPNQPYHLFETETDWQKGTVRLFLGTRKEGVETADFVNKAVVALVKIQTSPPKEMDGAIVVVNENYLIYWEHWIPEASRTHPGLEDLRQIAEPVVDQVAEPMRVVVDGFAEYSGPTVKGGECLNLQFARRREYPW